VPTCIAAIIPPETPATDPKGLFPAMTPDFANTPPPPLPDYAVWQATCDTLHGHTQVLGKLSAVLAPPLPGFQHVALRVTARGWETNSLPCPDGSGVIVAALDLQLHEAVLEHSDGRTTRIPLTPHRSVGEITQAVMERVHDFAGAAVAIDMTPQEVPWSVPLDQDTEHATYDTAQVAAYFAAATHAGAVLGAFRATHPGHATTVNAWWGSFDLAVSIYVDAVTDDGMPLQREVAVGWWPGDGTYPRPAWYAYVTPAPDGLDHAPAGPDGARWDATLGEFLFDWRDAARAPHPAAAELAFAEAIRDAAGA
jgi:hypothetical protein